MRERYRKMFEEGRGDDVLDEALHRILERPDITEAERDVAQQMLDARPP